MKQAPGSRTLPVLLILSLLVNMLLIGILVGQALAGSGPRDMPADGPPPPVEARMALSLLSTLDDEDRRKVARVFREAMRGNRAQMVERHQARRAITQALSAEPFDTAQMQAAFARLRKADAALQEGIQDTLAEEMAQLSPDQRAALAELLQRKFAGHRHRGRHRQGRRKDSPE